MWINVLPKEVSVRVGFDSGGAIAQLVEQWLVIRRPGFETKSMR